MSVRSFALLLLCLTVAGCESSSKLEPAIAGKWVSPGTEYPYLRIKDDGTFEEVALLKTSTGKYRILSKGTMEIDMPGLLYGRNVGKVEYKVAAETLELKYAGLGWVRYNRAK